MSVITATILSQGKKTDAGMELLHIDVSHEVNRIPTAQLTVLDGNIATRRFDWSHSDVFAHGHKIEIKLRYEGIGADKSVFKGIVVNQNVAAGDGYAHLVVEMRDESFKMCGKRHSKIYRDKKDSEIIKDLIGTHGLKTGSIADTKDKHPEIVQYDCTDWDFMLLRAEANGLLIQVEAGKISLVNPEKEKNAKHEFEFGMSPIYAFEMSADFSNQIGSIKTMAWDIKSQKMSAMQTGTASAPKQGNLNVSALSSKAGASEEILSTSGWRPTGELQTWANSRVMRNRLALFRGWLAVEGQNDLLVMDAVTIKGISNKFNGTNLITGVRHQVSAGLWRSEIQFGLSDEPFVCAFPNSESLPASGLLSAINGLHIGVVEAFKKDPEGQFRVRVRIPSLKSDDQTVWARQIQPDAGKERGIFFFPEVGDEVVLGFLNGDPREAMIVGSLHSSVNTVPRDIGALDEKNFRKGFFTKQNLQIKFDDEAKSITIQTPAGKKIVLDEKAKSIVLEDDHQNKITMNADGIKLSSGKDFVIDAKGKVEIKGTSVDVK